MGGRNAPDSLATTEEYSKSTNTITAAAFSSGASAGTARRQLGYSGAGTQDAFRVYGGFSPSGMIGNNEAYNGSSWSEGPDLNSARGQTSGGGTEPAAICFGGATPTIVGNTEEWNGSSWSEQNDLNTARMELGGAGTQTAGLACGGDTGPVPASALTEEYDGTSWTASNTLNTARRENSATGSQTAALCAGGHTPPATTNVESYNGTSWSEQNNMNTARGANHTIGGLTGQASALTTGGSPNFSITEQWNGTSMVTGASLSSVRFAHSAGGTTTSGIVGLGNNSSSSPPYGSTATEEYVGETTAANITDFTTS